MARDELAPRAAASFDANGTADFNASIRALELDEAQAILCARIAPNRTQGTRLWRVLRLLTGLLSNRDLSWQNRNNDRKKHFFIYSYIASKAPFSTDYFATKIIRPVW